MTEAITKPEVIDIFSDLAVNATKAVEGVWVNYRGNLEFLIGYTKSQKFKDKSMARYRKDEKVLSSGGKVASDKLESIATETMAEHTLLGWRTGDAESGYKLTAVFKGEELTYSKENAMRFLSVPAFKEWVAKQGDDLSTFKEVQEAEDAKN